MCFHVKANLVSFDPDYFAVINSEFYVIYQLDFFWCTKTHQAFRVGSTNISLRNQDLRWGDLQGLGPLGDTNQEASSVIVVMLRSPHTRGTTFTLW